MDPFAIIEKTWWLGIPVAFAMGIFLGVNPLALPVTGTAVGFGATGTAGASGGGVKLTAAFGAGLIAVYTAVGILAGRLDQIVEEVLRPYAGVGYLVLGVVLAAFAGWLLLKPAAFCTACALPARRNPTTFGAFMAGIPAGFVNCPACAAIITGVAASAAMLHNPFYGGAVMFALGLGHALVFVGLTWFLTKGWKPSPRALGILQKVSAILLLGIAAYFFYLASVQGVKPGPRLV